MSELTLAKTVDRQEWDTLTPLFNDLSYRQCGAYAEAAARDVGADSEFVAFFQAKELIGLANLRVKSLPFSSLHQLL